MYTATVKRLPPCSTSLSHANVLAELGTSLGTSLSRANVLAELGLFTVIASHYVCLFLMQIANVPDLILRLR